MDKKEAKFFAVLLSAVLIAIMLMVCAASITGNTEETELVMPVSTPPSEVVK